MNNKKRWAVFLAICFVLIVVGTILVRSQLSESVPSSAERAAVKAVEFQFGVTGVSIVNSARSGNCVIVRVQRPNTEENGPSVSLAKESNEWRVRKIGDDFDPDGLLGGGAITCP